MITQFNWQADHLLIIKNRHWQKPDTHKIYTTMYSAANNSIDNEYNRQTAKKIAGELPAIFFGAQ